MMSSTLGPENARSKYDEWHRDKDVSEYPDKPWHRLVRQYLRREDVVGRRVLEIGCGRGDFACSLVDQYGVAEPYVAADFSAVAVSMGRQLSLGKSLSQITWTVNDIQRLPFADRTFDTVISCETIEHVPDPKLALEELGRVLRPGGRLLLTTPNYLGTLGLYRMYMRLTGRRYTETGQPINRFMLLPLTRLWIARTGLRVKRVDATGHYLPIPGRPPVEIPFLNDPRHLMKWFALHSFVLAEKR